MTRSSSLVFKDFDSDWYKFWAKKLKQTPANKGKYALRANKFWQNAIIAQMLYERGMLGENRRGLGFGVGMERLPALFASLGVKVLATDQDFKQLQSLSWDNDQLAHGVQSLNVDNICEEKIFNLNVSYLAVDMKKIPQDLLSSKYDFLWSNCALGHLGSIEDGLNFMIKSLDCLKPGGWAVHTTEVNILSNKDTLDNSDTVFFRQKDLHKLFTQLSSRGYMVNALNLKLGKDPDDMRFTLCPKWGNDFSKILFSGYLATQVVIIISKPLKSTSLGNKIEVSKHKAQYLLNLWDMYMHRRRNKELAEVLAADRQAKLIKAKDTVISTLSPSVSLRLKRDESKTIQLRYKNLSQAGLFRLHNNFASTNPIAIATSQPINRESRFRDETWYEKNRPTIHFLQSDDENSRANEAEYVKPGKVFYIKMQIAAKNIKSGSYEERFCLVKEWDDVIPSTEVKLTIEVY